LEPPVPLCTSAGRDRGYAVVKTTHRLGRQPS
jgi:hypothetical protein